MALGMCMRMLMFMFTFSCSCSCPLQVSMPMPMPSCTHTPPELHEQDAHVHSVTDVANPLGFIGRLEPEADDVIANIMLDQLCSVGRAYRREAKSAMSRFVSEIYSPPRITQEIRQGKWSRVLPGFALDLIVCDPDDGLPWEFNFREKREKAGAMVADQKPILLVG